MPKLFVLTGTDAGAIHELSSDATLGRDAACTVRLRDPSVSRRHARVERSGGGWRVVDLGSRNGVRVGGKRVESAVLDDGAVFKCGELELRFRAEEGATMATVTVPSVRSRPKARVAEPVDAEPVDQDEPDEILLDEADAQDDEPPARRAPVKARPGSDTMARPGSGTLSRPGARPGSTVHRARPTAREEARPESRGVLQHHRIPDREGFFASDLAQQPAWVRLAAGLLVVLVIAGLGWAAFKGTAFLRQRTADSSFEATDDGE